VFGPDRVSPDTGWIDTTGEVIDIDPEDSE
jgi:hypothetical protein